MKKRYLFFDIDRTLTAGGYGHAYVPDSAKYALDRMRADGHFLSLATGRSEAMARAYMRELGFEPDIQPEKFSIPALADAVCAAFAK
jgi:hydroxymethylpyrimidine pyrophosphatase-like HAD family hydrolase